MDAFELLKADHKKVAELFDKLDAASGKTKLDVFAQIKSELELHTHIEETIFYPALERPEPTHDLTLEAYEEHKMIKTLLKELAGASTASEEWQAKAKVLRETVEHHVDEEENELFDRADNALTEEEIEALGNRMEAEKARKQGTSAPKRSATKGARSSKANAGKPGILSKIADFVGLGSKTTKKRTAKKSTKKTATRKASKAGAKAGSRKKAGKSASATARKRSSAAKVSKKASSRRSGTRKTTKR